MLQCTNAKAKFDESGEFLIGIRIPVATKRKSCGDLKAHVADERTISLSYQKAALPSFWQERSTLHPLPFRA